MFSTFMVVGLTDTILLASCPNKSVEDKKENRKVDKRKMDEKRVKTCLFCH